MFKKIEVVGFKSFADRLEVDFSSGITCIVGPNGCGKSNVSDAIRWVLGEQSSKALRGTNMQDVIFKGTENRKQLSYCEVSLFFDNENKIFPVDYSEVVLSRKLYRSGESEYYVNRNLARLKDITTLLHDSGIDRDGLTIIGQGQVTDLIHAKPEARRGIFEEAAGIAKFKARKTEAERKLERVQTELTRVRDVITEIERTLGPLLKQAETARKYIELRDHLKSLEINNYIHTYDNVSSVKQRLTEHLEQVSSELQARQEEIEEFSKGSTRAMEQLTSIDARAEILREQVLNLSLGLERHKSDSRLVEEKVKILREQQIKLIQEIADLKERIEFEQKNLESGQQLYQSLINERERVAQGLRNATEDYTNKSELATTFNNLQTKREKLLSRRETIQSLIQSGEGFKYTVRKIIDATTKNSVVANNIVGVVAKELTVPTNLEIAIEVALGAAAQNIITATEDNAKNMIELLQRENWGRATFLPISSVKPRIVSQEERNLFKQSGALGIASELVEYNPKLEPVIGSLLGRVIIVDKIDRAINLAKSSRYAFKIVTLDGDVIETRGSITGGSKSAINNNLWHTQNLATIETELKQIEDQIAKIGKDADERGAAEEVTKLRIRASALESEITAVRTSIERGEETLALLNGTHADKAYTLDSINRNISNVQPVVDEGEADEQMVEEIMKRLDMARQELSNFDTRKEELRTYIADAEERRNQAQDSATKLHEQYYKTSAQLEKVDTDLATMGEEIYEKYGVNYSSCYEFKSTEFDAENAKQEITEYRRAISRLGPVNLDAIEQSKESGERYESYTTQVNDLESAKTDLEKVIGDLAGEMDGLFKTTFDTINANFAVTFKELFGGGRARLELTNPNDYLNSGIDIVAEPPGKKLQNLSLLSGGEKALTAIAILFAILKLKPMPFCLLDEIEAALDEANVGRFANYLHNFSRSTQFIVITHRKPTMELADHLYGVTMEEKGVSKLVSVKLEAYA
ncbi:MAG: AAA family ATPase [Firmicutes bacterium]|nr:AAA family ATPase [Bacillota bacterium]